MKQSRDYLREHAGLVGWLVLAVAGLSWLLLNRLGSLTGGLSAGELSAATAPVGWHGIYHQPLDLPLKLVRSVVFVLFPNHGQALTRLPNVLFGALAIVSFAWLVRLWHGTRTAIMASLLFATSAWVLHASRLASFDVLYLWATPTLLLVYMQLQKHKTSAWAWYGSLLVWGLLLYVPGMVWLVLVAAYWQRGILVSAWRHFGQWRQRLLYLLAGLVWLPLLVVDLRRPGELRAWLGLPAHFARPATVLKQFVAVPAHLFVRGPQYPDIWLGRAPVLDVFALAACVIGIYFYVTHRQAGRSRLLGSFAVVGFVLVGLNGPVGLSLLVPLLYVGAATGIAYLLHEWLSVFPNNPLARGLGIGLLALVVGLSCVYNLRAYFVAWPHNQTTQAIFQYRR
jgi:4-amino-4-deoxy-L-arabinose transferase-like glycosyltransferase